MYEVISVHCSSYATLKHSIASFKRGKIIFYVQIILFVDEDYNTFLRNWIFHINLSIWYLTNSWLKDVYLQNWSPNVWILQEGSHSISGGFEKIKLLDVFTTVEISKFLVPRPPQTPRGSETLGFSNAK